MLAACGGHGPLHIPALAGPAGRPPDRCGPAAGARWRRRAGSGEAPRPVVARAGAGLSSFFSSRIGLDSQTFQAIDSPQLLWVGPVPGDIAEVEAYCRIFRAAEQLHGVIMKTLCDPETGECAVSYTTPSEDLQLLEDRVVALLGCMVALLNRGREDVLSGRSSFANSHDVSEGSTGDEKLPPLAVFRREMKRCCESLQLALSNYLTPFENRSADIWTRLQRLKNVCYDAGFARGDGYPPPTLFANWSPVYFSSGKEDRLLEDSEVAFWKGGQVTEEGLRWLREKGYRTIVDLREDAVKDGYYQSAVGQAVSRGEVEVVNLPVEVGTAPSMELVEKFASLVSDPNRRPLYLHSQEGVNRTSAMVSRWRQYISRSSIKVVSNHHVNLNGKPPDDARDVENLFVSPKLQGGTRVDDKNDSQPELDAAYNHNGTSSGQGSFAAQNEHESGKVTQRRTSVHDSDTTSSVKVESFANFSMENDPFMAQAPRCDIFSRRQMTSFLKNKKISPTTYLNSQRRKSEILSIQGDPCKSPVQSNKAISTQLPGDIPQGSSNGTSRDKDVSFRSNDIRISDGKHVSREVSPSCGATVNGISGGESCIAINPEHSSNVNNSFSRQSLSTAIGESMREKNNGSPDSVGDSLDVEGNMCASTTGVVRVQSRKKAEMFLVRTDGFSCTREKVTESSLAFTHPSTQQQMLMWKSPPKTVLLLKKLGNELMEEAKEVAAYLFYREKMNVLVEPDVHDIFARIPGFGFVQTFYSQDTSDLHERVDLVACLGGDGVILHASNLFRGAVPPVVSFNLGSLGFLTSHTFEEYKQDLRAVIHGNNTLDGVYITLRMRLRCEVFRNGKAMPGKVFDVLNEVVVDRGSNPYLSKIECYEHNRLITKVQGDGVIVATPTGSTAYSTAAGGSMVHPNVPCMLFTPICPHSLSFRPVILPDSAWLELKIPQETRNNAWVSFDGKRRQQLSRGDSVRICMSQHPLPTVNKSDQTGDWFHSLIRCLNWNERLDQKAL